MGALPKLIGLWSEGRINLPLPRTPNQLDDLSKLAANFCRKHKLGEKNKKTVGIVEELMLVLKMREEA